MNDTITKLQEIADRLSDKARYCMKYNDPYLKAFADDAEEFNLIKDLQSKINM